MEHGGTKGGRPRGFDRDGAVAVAMRLFWRHGFEGVSTATLSRAMGIAPPSLYAAFGSKADLYREALDLYARQAGAFAAAWEGVTSPAEGLRRMFDQAIAAVADPASNERGCMISTGLVEAHPEHAGLAAELAGRRQALRDAIATEMARWLPPAEADGLARLASAVLQGIAVQARDGATPDELRAVAAAAVACASRSGTLPHV